MHITTLASGSGGNSTLISSGGTHILIDAGISTRRICTGLREVGLAPADISGILITHEHSDHVSGLAVMTKNHKVPIYAPRTVANYLRRTIAGVEDCLNIISPGEAFAVGESEVRAFRTPHDAPESVGYRVSMDVDFGLCTDLGHVTDEIFEALCGVDVALIESNHDEDMLRSGNYPYYLKRRILSDNGHLSNLCCGTFAVQLAKAGAGNIILGHLSRENNLPSLALSTVTQTLAAAGFSGTAGPKLTVAPAAELRSVHMPGSADSCLA